MNAYMQSYEQAMILKARASPAARNIMIILTTTTMIIITRITETTTRLNLDLKLYRMIPLLLVI